MDLSFVLESGLLLITASVVMATRNIGFLHLPGFFGLREGNAKAKALGT